jgi:hypothetical protein
VPNHVRFMGSFNNTFYDSILLLSKKPKTLTNSAKHKTFTKHLKLLSPLCHITAKNYKNTF